MKQEKPKKKSLFSQRIQQTRDKLPSPVEEPFPKAVKIDLSEQKSTCENIAPSNPQTNTKFIDKLLGSYLKEEQIQQIKKENIKSLENMSLQQIQQYQSQILQTMPTLTKKLKIINTTSASKIIDEEKIQEKGSEMIDQNEAKLQQKEFQQNLGLLNLCIDIKKMKIKIFSKDFHNQDSDLISSASLKLMIQSQNNQTQIVSSHLLVNLCNQLFKKTNQCIPIVKIEGVAFHLVILAEQIYTNLLVSLMFQINKTTFKSCYIEMIKSLLESYNAIKIYLLHIQNKNLNIKLVQFLEEQRMKKKQWMIQSQTKNTQNNDANIFNLSHTVSLLNQEILNYSVEQSLGQIIEKCRKYPNMVVEQIIQELLFISSQSQTDFQTLLEKVTKQLQIKFKKQKCENILQFTLPLAQDILSQQIHSNFMNNEHAMIKEALYQWILLNNDNEYLIQNIEKNILFNSEESEQRIFKILFITKILNAQKYIEIISKNEIELKKIEVQNETVSCMLVYLNIYQYFNINTIIKSESDKNKQILLIQSMLDWLIHKIQSKSLNFFKTNPHFVVMNILSIFLNYLQPNASTQECQSIQEFRLSYNDLSSELLQKLLDHLCKLVYKENKIESMWFMIPQQKIKSLIESYNFDSFGNYIFTKFILFLASSSPNKLTEALFLEQIVQRYPFLFYYACEKGVYGPSEAYLSGKTTPQMTTILEMLSVSNKTSNKNNMLVRYLTKQ